MRKRSISVLMVISLLTGCQFNLSGDILPPEEQHLDPAAQMVPLEAFPIIPPDPQSGGRVYQEFCAPCHGLTGLGDGQLALSMPNRVASLQDPEVFVNASLADWFTLVTYGDDQTGMPSFRHLSEADRWNAVAYSLLIGISTKDLATGLTLYSQNCATCHGINGRGDEIDRQVQTMPNFQDTQLLTNRSTRWVWEVISDGLNEDMPAFAPQLSESDRWSLAAYIRTLSFWNDTSFTGNIPTPAGVPISSTILPDDPVATFTVTGTVENPNGLNLPDGLVASVEGYGPFAGASQLELVWQMQTPINANGSYTMADVPIMENWVYFVTVVYQGLAFRSESITNESIQPGEEVNLPISVFDSSSDRSALRIRQLHVIITFTDDGMMQVAEMFMISNPTLQVIVPEVIDDPVLGFAIPDEGQELTFSGGIEGERFILTEQGFGDRQVIAPGDDHQVIFAYQLPYDGAAILSLTTPLLTETLILLIPSGSVLMENSLLRNEGRRDIQGMDVQLYSLENLAPDSSVDLVFSGELNGEMHENPTAIPSGVGEKLLVGIILLLVSVWMILVIMHRRRGESNLPAGLFAPPPKTEETLIDDILLLDDLYQNGKLDEMDYHQRRDQLKEQLKFLLARKKTPG